MSAQAGLFDLAGDGRVSRATLRVLLQQFPTGSGLLDREILSGARVQHKVPLSFACTNASVGLRPELQSQGRLGTQHMEVTNQSK